MNIAIGRKTLGRNPRFGFGILIAALVVAAILTGVTVWQFAGAGSSTTVVEPVVAPDAISAVQTTNRTITPTYYYLVDSQAQGDAIVQADFENQTNELGPGAGFDHNSYAIDMSTPEGQALFLSLEADLQETAASDPNYDAGLIQIHDLTSGETLQSASSVSRTAATVGPVETTIYIVASEADRLALNDEVDTASAVEGTDFVAPNVMVVGSPEDERLYGLMLLELQATQTTTVDIVDLR